MSEAGQYLTIQRQRISYEATRKVRWGAHAQREDMLKEPRPPADFKWTAAVIERLHKPPGRYRATSTRSPLSPPLSAKKEVGR